MSFKGSLAELPLSDLIEMTALGGKTGLLTVFDEQGAIAGELAFRNGRIVRAECGDLQAEKAFYGILAVEEGSFGFELTAVLGDESCDLSTESLLMEGMRRIDETQRLRATLPAPARVRYQKGDAQDATEARVLGYLGPGARSVGDIVEGVLVGGEADEYDALQALQRLAAREVVRIEIAHDTSGGTLGAGGLPQPELER